MTIICRRGLLAGAVAAMAGAALPVRAAPGRTALLSRAKAALDRPGLSVRDRLVLADFDAPSRTPRLDLVDLENGSVRSLLVAHGRGSDPAHSGWVERFSNEPGSYASSAGAYAAATEYTGKHGRSLRLVGLDPTNNNAEARAIVVHAAWYVGPDMVRDHGKLGRSEGCFAVSDADLAPVLAWLKPGTLLFAGKA
jgi:hypothetical protein